MLIKNAVESNQHIAIKSTRLQLERYVNWWHHTDFIIPESFLVSDSVFLKSIIEALKAQE